MLYANGQDSAVRSLLENSTRSYRSGPGERLWLMLFDLFRLTGQKAAFESLGIEYAQSFEKSPPGWRDTAVAVPVHAKVVGSVLFKGELTGDNDAGFEAVRQALAKNRVFVSTCPRCVGWMLPVASGFWICCSRRTRIGARSSCWVVITSLPCLTP